MDTNSSLADRDVPDPEKTPDEFMSMQSSPQHSYSRPRIHFRQRAGTWGGNTSCQLKKDKDKNNRKLEDEVCGLLCPDSAKDWKRRLLTVKQKFSRKNRWGNCSYKALIIEAICQSPQQKMTLNEIYDWIVTNIDFFKGERDTNSSAGWKNSIRHNLSLHSIFIKEPQQNGTKAIGCYWMIDKSKDIEKESKTRKRCHTTDPTQRELALARKNKRLLERRAIVSPIDSVPCSPSNSIAHDSGFSPESSPSSLSNSIEFSPSFKTEAAISGFEVKTIDQINSAETVHPKVEIIENEPIPEEKIDVCVRVPFAHFELYKTKKFTFCLIPKKLVGRKGYENLQVIPEPEPTEVRKTEITQSKDNEFKTPEAPTISNIPFSPKKIITDSERNFSQLSLNDCFTLDSIETSAPVSFDESNLKFDINELFG